jgi:hypothetical protein
MFPELLGKQVPEGECIGIIKKITGKTPNLTPKSAIVLSPAMVIAADVLLMKQNSMTLPGSSARARKPLMFAM